MNNPKPNSPKVPPFVFEESSVQAKKEPVSRPLPPRSPVRKYNNHPSERGMLNAAILLISSLSLGIALAGGAWIGLGILRDGMSDQPGLLARMMATGLAYLVGWVVGLFGMRKLGNLILPIVIKGYAWLTLSGIALLQIAIVTKLFKQLYTPEKFIAYVAIFGAGLAALIGIHLLIEKHNLVPFSFPILIISLAHLYFIVFHYVFVPHDKVKYEYIWGDVTFFLIASIVGVLMLAHLGILSGLRNSIDRRFSENTDHFVPLR